MTESRALTKHEPAEMQMVDRTGGSVHFRDRDREEFTLKRPGRWTKRAGGFMDQR